jgi:hypothetical protein
VLEFDDVKPQNISRAEAPRVHPQDRPVIPAGAKISGRDQIQARSIPRAANNSPIRLRA